MESCQCLVMGYREATDLSNPTFLHHHLFMLTFAGRSSPDTQQFNGTVLSHVLRYGLLEWRPDQTSPILLQRLQRHTDKMATSGREYSTLAIMPF